MDRIENNFKNLCLNNNSSSGSDSGVTTICSHQILKRRVTTEEATVSRNEVYQCEQCHERCLVTFGISSYSHPTSSAVDESSSSASASSKSSHSIEFENASNSHSEGKSNEEEETLDTIPSRLKYGFVCVDNEVLGKGSFGAVAKFRNKKDEKIYAIKKITKVTKRKEREVKVLSTLQHENIVRYYNCWPEPNDSAFPKENEDEDESLEDSDDEEVDPINENVLYIQMEFCEKGTLREAIDSGDFVRNKFRMWKLFRQIVEGIKYFHSKDVIHRDLKPENVFLNSDDCVKIGDFGLATANLRPNLDNAAQTSSSHDDDNNYTMGDCGTNLYKAPEVVTGKYDKKSDMYSLGILFLEMCRGPYKTEMERRTELTEFRTENYVIPPDIKFISLEQEYFVERYFSEEASTKLTNKMVKILEKLLVHNPEQRFSAEELLRSSNMHPPLLDDIPEFFQLADFIIASTGKDSKYQEYYALMRRILCENTSEADIFKWLDKEKFGRSHSDVENDFRNSLKYPSFHEIFIKRCQEMGAQYLQPATLLPKLSIEKAYEAEELKQLATLLAYKSSRSFIDEHGTLALLPGDSHTIFARHVASYNIITELKRYCVNHVYTDHVIGTPPEPSTELAFDIVSSSAAESSALRKADAEVVQVIKNVLQDCGLPSIVIKLSHYSLLQAILTYCNIPSDGQRSKVCRQAKKELERFQFNRPSGFSTNLDVQMKSLLSLLVVHGHLDDVKTRLASLPDWVGSEAASMADTGFIDLEEIISNVIYGDDQEGYPVYIDLSVGLEYYDNLSGFDGFLFSFVYKEYQDQYPSLTNAFSYDGIVLAAGGRYDSLVAHFGNAIASPENQFNQNWLTGSCRKETRTRNKQFAVGGAIYMRNLVKEDFTQFKPNRPLTFEEFSHITSHLRRTNSDSFLPGIIRTEMPRVDPKPTRRWSVCSYYEPSQSHLQN